MADILQARVEQKVDTLAGWLANPLPLLPGEQAFVKSDIDNKVIAFKMSSSDGTLAFSALPWPNFTVADKAAPSKVFNSSTPSGVYMPTADGTYGGSVAVVLTDGYQVLYWDGTTLIKINFGGTGYLRAVDMYQLQPGTNLIDQNASDKQIGFFIQSDGTRAANATYNTTGKIAVVPAQQYAFTNARFWAFYNSSDVFISGSYGSAAPANTVITAPSGAAYIRGSVLASVWATAQMQLGTNFTTYVPYVLTKVLKDNSGVSYYADAATDALKASLATYVAAMITINTSQLVDAAVTPVKTSFMGIINLYNPADPNVVVGQFLNSGVLSPNAAYTTTGKITANPGDVIVHGNNGTQFNLRFIYAYNSSNAVVGGSDDSTRTSFTLPAGASYFRTSFVTTDNPKYQIQKGTITAYQPYQYTILPAYLPPSNSNLNLLIDSITGQVANTKSQASLTAGSVYSVTDFPMHLKKSFSMSFYAEFSAFSGSVTFGKGNLQFRGDYLKIDATNIYWIHYETSEVVTAQFAHGLTFSTFIKCYLYIDDSSKCNFVIQSLNGYYKNFFQFNYEANYQPFVLTTGQALSNLKIDCTAKDFKHPVWAFGDSYFGVDPTRWPGTMKVFGFFNFLLNGLAGQVSSAALIDLQKALSYGTPKYLLWCLGMNDTDAQYQSALTTVQAICITKGITLILGIVPTVPTRSKEVIKTTILATGLRNIDFYHAVGANSSGIWYTGYQDPDGIHPSILGAPALATQVLIDFPELMQYGVTIFP